MLKPIFWALKWGTFAILVLLAAHIVEWRGRTVSDHLRVSLAKARTTDEYRGLRGWTERFIEGKPRGSAKRENTSTAAREIAPTEREKLKQLLREIQED